MLARGLAPEFSQDALSEAAHLAAAPVQPAARDMTALPFCSIDNDDTRDIDQLTWAEVRGDTVRVLVAIADVDVLVHQGGAIDAHAAANTTSVYTPGGIFPMLPENLSTHLTALTEHDVRAAMVVDIAIAQGSVKGFDVYRAMVRNHAKLTYGAVSAWLDGRAAVPAALAGVDVLADNVRLQDRAAQAIRDRRFECGALSLHTPQATAVFAGDAIVDVKADDGTRAHELIENLMIAANTATAKFLDARGFPSLRRVLPMPRRWERIAAIALERGESLPGEPDGQALQAFLDRQRSSDPQGFPDLSLSIVKLLGSGEYAAKRPGQPAEPHFGLAVRGYTHSTAPNRRFPDLVTQRLLKSAIAGDPPPYDDTALAALAAHCTLQEDNAAKVERQVRKSAAALLLRSRIGERFDALVTGASAKGTWVRIGHPMVEGRLVRGSEGIDVGDRLRVQLVATDVDQGFIDFARDAS